MATSINIPELSHHCNSWVAISRATNEVIGEFYCEKTLKMFDPTKIEIKTTASYLADLNERRKRSNDQTQNLHM
ncbi:MAG: hypothetical protein FWF12_00290 [Betaproteobacteria bacterium]|nr:hypothetical protein [Betaproteobacteria bacterium]